MGMFLVIVKSDAFANLQNTGENIVIVIDPGHGGENEGTIENGFQEKSMTLITAQAMYEELMQYEGVSVHMTRMDDRDMSLKERAEFAKEVNADFLYSIHYNASIEHDLFGSEVWISLQPPFHGYGYQFAYLHLSQMQEMGLFLRGIKTKANDKGTDYYGILREATDLGIPSALIEHCHVDEERDVPFCDTNEKLIAFGKADAKAVAQYFGLHSTSLGVDYSEYPYLAPSVNNNTTVEKTMIDTTPPDICTISIKQANYEQGTVTIEMSAADFDSMLLYYDYSIDGGLSYSALQTWPESNALTGVYADTFSFTLEIPDGVIPNITARAYNLFDFFTVSNVLSSFQVFNKEILHETEISALENNGVQAVNESKNIIVSEDKTNNNIQNINTKKDSGDTRFTSFLVICLVIAGVVLVTVLVLQVTSHKKRSKRAGQRRKVAGDRKYQPK